jgi:hypothetical protein
MAGIITVQGYIVVYMAILLCIGLYWGAKEEQKLFFGEPPDEGGILTK